MQKKPAYPKVTRWIAALMTAAMMVSISTPLTYAAEATESANTNLRPVVTAQQPATEMDGEPKMSTSLTYDSSYADTAPDGSEYAGTLSGLGMNVYKQTASYADLGFSSAAEMDAAFDAARAEVEAESEKEYEKNIAWLHSMLTAEDIVPMREEAEQISEAIALLQESSEEERPVTLANVDSERRAADAVAEGKGTAATPENAATPETASSGVPEDEIALYASELDADALAQKKAAAAALLAAKGIDLNTTAEDDAAHFSISTLGDVENAASVQDAQGSRSSSVAQANITVVDDDSLIVCVYDENDQPLDSATVQLRWQYKQGETAHVAERTALTKTVDETSGVAVINNMGPTTCEDKSDLHRGYVMVSCPGYRTVEQLDADFNAGTRINFKLTKQDRTATTPYASATDLDGVNLLNTTYTLNLSPKANDPYDMTITMRNIGGDFGGQVALYRIGEEDEPPAEIVTEIPAANLITATGGGMGKDELSYTAVFNKRWGTLEYGSDHVLAPNDKLYIYWRDKENQWHRYSQINLKVDQATNEAWWKELSLSLTGSGYGTLTLPKGLGEINTDILNFNMYATLDLSGKLMVGYGRDWFRDQDKDEFESSAYKPSGGRWSQMGERLKENVKEHIKNKEQIHDFTDPTKVMCDWYAMFDLYGCLIAQWNTDTGYYAGDVAFSMGFEAHGEATFYVLVPIPPVGLPLYAGIEGNGSARLELDVGAQFKADDFATFLRTLQISNSTGATLEIELSAAVYAGIGLRKVASVEANLACSLDMIFGFGTANTRGQHYPFHTQGIFDWGLSIKARVFFITYTYEIFADEDNPMPGQKKVLWDKWLGDPIGNYGTQALLMQRVAEDTDHVVTYRTDMDAVSEGVYDADSGEVSMTGQAAMLAAMQTNDNETALIDNVLGGAPMQILTARGGANKDCSYLFRIASVTDKATGKATPRLTVQNAGKCSSTLGETYVLPAPATGEDAGKLPHDYNFSVCDDSDGGTGNFTIAVTTGYLDENSTLRERAHDLRVRVYRFDSETNTFAELRTLMPRYEESAYCGIPAVYTYGDKYFVATLMMTNVGNSENITEQIGNTLVWATNIDEYGDGQEIVLRRGENYSRILLKPTAKKMELYVEDDYQVMLYRYEVSRSSIGPAQNGSALYIDGEIGSETGITNLGYVNGCPGRKNRIVFVSDNKLWMPFTEWNDHLQYEETVGFELTDVTGAEILLPKADNSLLFFSDGQPNEFPLTGDGFHAIAVASAEDSEKGAASRIYSYDFTYQSKQDRADSRDHTRYLCPNTVRNQIQILQNRSVSSFTASYHGNENYADCKDLRLIYMADDEDTVISKPDASGVGTVVSKCSLYNYELKKARDAAITQFAIASKSVDKKDGTFEVTYTIKNTGIGALQNVSLKLKQEGGTALAMGTTENSAVSAALSEDKKELTLSPKKGALNPGEAMTYTAKVTIPVTWMSGDVSLTAGITKIDGKALSEWIVEPYAAAVYAAEQDEFDKDHSVTEEIDAPTLDMQVQELVYSDAAEKESHYAEITFRNDNILDVENAELQVYGFQKDSNDNIQFVKLQGFMLNTLSADGNLEKVNAGYTVLVPLLDEWQHQGFSDNAADLWFLYFVLCDKDADPFGIADGETGGKTIYDMELLTNLFIGYTAAVKTESEDPFMGYIVPDTEYDEDGSLLYSEYADGLYEAGETVKIQAQAEAGYVFGGWYYQGTDTLFSANNPCEFTTEENTDYCLEARFKPDPANKASYVSITTSGTENGVPLGSAAIDYSDNEAEARMMENGAYAFAVFEGGSLHLKATAYDEDAALFDGWYLLDANGDPTGQALSKETDFTYTPQGDGTLQAVFIPMPESCVKVYLNPCEGRGADFGWQRTGADGKLASLPTPEYDGHAFVGWFTDPDGGEPVTTDTVFTGRAIVYAHYKESTDPVQPDDPERPSDPTNPDTPAQPGGQTIGNSSGESNSPAVNKTESEAAQAAGIIPRTADDFPLVFVVVLLVIGAGGFAVMVLLRKRKK